MKKRATRILCGILAVASLCIAVFFAVRSRFPRPYRQVTSQYGVDELLVYAVMKAESGFDECAVSSAGAVGLMQLLPSTAQFVCAREGLAYESDKLFAGEYNARLGTLYLKYLLGKFECVETALAAYNAGEGVVRGWLYNKTLSPDGKSLVKIPYPETERYVKKVIRFRKIYDFFY